MYMKAKLVIEMTVLASADIAMAMQYCRIATLQEEGNPGELLGREDLYGFLNFALKTCSIFSLEVVAERTVEVFLVENQELDTLADVFGG